MRRMVTIHLLRARLQVLLDQELLEAILLDQVHSELDLLELDLLEQVHLEPVLLDRARLAPVHSEALVIPTSSRTRPTARFIQMSNSFVTTSPNEKISVKTATLKIICFFILGLVVISLLS